MDHDNGNNPDGDNRPETQDNAPDRSHFRNSLQAPATAR
jgi:hypothetical protein